MARQKIKTWNEDGKNIKEIQKLKKQLDFREQLIAIATKRIREIADEKHELERLLDDANYSIAEKNEEIGNATAYIRSLEDKLTKEGI